MYARKALAKSREAFDRGLHRGCGDASLRVEACAEAQCLAPGILPVDLVALDAADFKPEAVRPEVDDGKSGCGHDVGSVAESEGRA